MSISRLRNAALLFLFLLAHATSGEFTDLGRWNGLTTHPESDSASFAVPGTVQFTYPDGDKGWYRIGMGTAHDGSGNWRGHYGVRIEIHLPTDVPLELEATLEMAPRKVNSGSTDVVDRFTSRFGIAGLGWHTVTIPLHGFTIESARPAVLETVKSFGLQAAFSDGTQAKLQVRNPRLVQADIVHLDSMIRSGSAAGGETVSYDLQLTNCTDQSQQVTLFHAARGREAMTTTIVPAALTLAAGETGSCEVRVTVSPRVAPGGHEKQTIRALANGREAGEVEYITLHKLEHPYLLHTEARWNAVREKAATVAWAREAAADYVQRADRWKVPALNQGGVSSATNCGYLYASSEEKKAFGVAVAYQLTGDPKYAEKVARFLRQLADPERGFPKTNQACHKSLVQEGNFFQYCAFAYDMIHDSGALSDADHAHIAHTFRLYHKIIDQHLNWGITGNWRVAELCGALYSALAIQDLAAANRFIEGPGGFIDQISHGLMSDGWWYECSIAYNTWVASEFTQLALALQPFGVDYLHAAFPATYSREYNIFSVDAEARKKLVYGKPFQKWGPVRRPYVKIKDMWDALPPFIDYNGVMFATNDSTENKFKENYYEIGYFAYRDPTYAAIIKLTGVRDLLYGVAELPKHTPELGRDSAFSDNAGVSMLRSTAEEPRERIQAVLEYGTHGGYHGHFDRASLTSLMRYGRSFYCPEHIWYSYPNFMYAFFVQTSLPHNMVVVDMKQQEPVESSKLLFSTGALLQVTAVETKARWTRPPYGGIKYSWFTGETFQEKCWEEGRYMPIPDEEPGWGTMGDYSDRVTQRRLLAVTDDYILLADALEAPEAHTFDCLFNIKGFQGLESDAGAEPVRHTEQMDPNPVLPAQLITDCNWYAPTGTAKVRFETQFGKDADNAGTRIFGVDGILKMDVYSAWPRDRDVMIGTLPEAHGVNRKFWYRVHGDDQVLAEGRFGAWILGREAIDVPLEGVDTLTLTTRTEYAKKDAPRTLFWGDPVIVTAEGKTLSLTELQASYRNIHREPASGTDYYGGPVKIAGRHFPRSMPANPTESGIEGTIAIDLAGLQAVRFRAQVGGDYPLGNESWRRKSLSFRTTGSQTRYLTVIEPYEDQPVVRKVVADSANEVTVELVDGRTHVLSIANLDNGRNIGVRIKEYRDGALLGEETHPRGEGSP